jgi:hypothetical protein
MNPFLPVNKKTGDFYIPGLEGNFFCENLSHRIDIIPQTDAE